MNDKSNYTNMKTKVRKSGMLTLWLILLLLASSMVYGEEYKKTISEKYDVQPGAVLKIDNKFGDVVCNKWDKMTISIDVTITVHSSSQDKANKVFDKIRVTLSGTDRIVEGVTTIQEMKGNNKFSIDYTINMPADLNVELKNKYGMMLVEEVKRSSKIDLKYGDLKVGNLLNSANQIWVKYGNCDIEHINQGKVNVAYADLDIDDANTLEVSSKYNDVSIDHVNDLIISTAYDDISIDHLKTIKAEAKFSVFDIDHLEESLDIDMEYGGCQVDEVSGNFSAITILAQYTGIELEFEEGASYQVSVDVSYSGVDFPSNSNIVKKKHSHTSALYEGYVGSNSSAPAKVMIKARHGGVELK